MPHIKGVNNLNARLFFSYYYKIRLTNTIITDSLGLYRNVALGQVPDLASSVRYLHLGLHFPVKPSAIGYYCIIVNQSVIYSGF